ncbi:MAG TPA: TolC family protein, partial [Terriglobia bacterium]|nr:TolC family protein [Terriglobia bacterium]
MPGAEGQTRIDLDQAIQLALAHNHALQADRTLILQNQAQEVTANLRPNPNINFTSQYVPFFTPQDFSLDTL